MSILSLIATIQMVVTTGSGMQHPFCRQPGLAAFYLPAQNYLHVCIPVDVESSIRHEAIHLVQDCKAGLHNSLMSTITTEAHQGGYGNSGLGRYIQRNYSDPSHWGIEYEAHLGERLSNAQIAGLIRRYCL